LIALRWLHVLAMAFFVGGQMFLAAAVASHKDKWDDTTLQVKLALVALVAVLVSWHMSRPELHVLEGAIFLASLAIVWLGLALAH